MITDKIEVRFSTGHFLLIGKTYSFLNLIYNLARF